MERTLTMMNWPIRGSSGRKLDVDIYEYVKHFECKTMNFPFCLSSQSIKINNDSVQYLNARHFHRFSMYLVLNKVIWASVVYVLAEVEGTVKENIFNEIDTYLLNLIHFIKQTNFFFSRLLYDRHIEQENKDLTDQTYLTQHMNDKYDNAQQRLLFDDLQRSNALLCYLSF